MPNIKLLMGLEANAAGAAKHAGQLLFTTDGGHIYFDVSDTERVTLYKDVIDNTAALAGLVGTKSVATQIQEAITALAGGEGSASEVTFISSIIAGNGVTVDATNKNSPTVGVKLRSTNNIIKIDETDKSIYVAAEDAKDYTVTIDEVTEGLGENVAKAYRIQQAATNLDKTINIPADMVVSSGTVTTYTSEDLPEGVENAGTYLVLTLANATKDKVYINVGDLIEYVTSGSDEATDDVIVTVSGDHKVTAALSETVKASLAKADKAVQPSALATSKEDKKYIAGVTVDSDTGAITFDKEPLPELQWETF